MSRPPKRPSPGARPATPAVLREVGSFAGPPRRAAALATPAAPPDPRVHLLEYGPAALPDRDLIEVLLGLSGPAALAKPLAAALHTRFGSFAGVLTAPLAALRQVAGLDDPALVALRLVRAAALRLAEAELRAAPLLTNWERLLNYLTATLAREPIEHFRVLYLDSRNALIADERLGSGTVNNVPVYPREVVKRALELHATAMILVHNHPSGDSTPSEADVEMTEQIRLAAEALDIAVHDHLIVGRTGTTSLRREGLM